MATLTMPEPAFTKERLSGFDELLFDICEQLQITLTQHQKAEDRYKTIGRVITAFPGFAGFVPEIYPQGSMKLRTTTKPIDGWHKTDNDERQSLDTF